MPAVSTRVAGSVRCGLSFLSSSSSFSSLVVEIPARIEDELINTKEQK